MLKTATKRPAHDLKNSMSNFSRQRRNRWTQPNCFFFSVEYLLDRKTPLSISVETFVLSRIWSKFFYSVKGIRNIGNLYWVVQNIWSLSRNGWNIPIFSITYKNLFPSVDTAPSSTPLQLSCPFKLAFNNLLNSSDVFDSRNKRPSYLCYQIQSAPGRFSKPKH